MNERSKSSGKLIFVALLVAGISIAIYATHVSQPFARLFLQFLYFLPLFLSAFWFGLRGALAVSLSITGAYVPFVVINWGIFSPQDFERLLELLTFNVVAALLGYLRDREKERQRRLLESESLAAMGRAVSSLAHDMKTPLIAIGGFSRLVRRKYGEFDPDREKLDIVIEETERLESMVKDMLDFSSYMKLNRSEEDIGRIVTETFAIIEQAAGQKNVRLESSIPPDLPFISCDRVRIKEMLINLLNNAVDFSPEEESVRVSAHRDSTILVVEVSDHGPGIPPEDREKVFLPFYTTKSGGTGLGLPIVKKIAEAHEGRIEIVDERKEHTLIFRVSLPMHPPKEK